MLGWIEETFHCDLGQMPVSPQRDGQLKEGGAANKHTTPQLSMASFVYFYLIFSIRGLDVYRLWYLFSLIQSNLKFLFLHLYVVET